MTTTAFDRLTATVHRLLGRRCKWDCGQTATWTLKTHCGCDTYLCDRHATESFRVWLEAPHWHCNHCDARGVGSVVKAMSRL